MFESNIICANGHAAYAPNPEAWVTQDAAGPFCVNAKCAGHFVPVKLMGDEFRWQSMLAIDPPETVEAE